MKFLLACSSSLLFLAGSSPETQRLAFDYQTGWTYETRAESSTAMTCADVQMWIGDEEVETDAASGLSEMIGSELSSKTTVVVTTNEVEAVEAGIPTTVLRSFDELSREETNEGEAREPNGPLEGRTVRIVQSPGEDPEVELLGEEDIDDEYLADHEIGIEELAVLLSDEDVEEGDSWTVSAALLERVVRAVGPTLFEPEDDGSQVNEEELNEALAAELLNTEIEVEWADTVERGGESCAELSFLLEVELELDDLDAEDWMGESAPGEDVTAFEIGFAAEFDARVWVSLDEQRIVADEVDGHADLTMMIEFVVQGEVEIRLEFEMDLESESATSWTYE